MYCQRLPIPILRSAGRGPIGDCYNPGPGRLEVPRFRNHPDERRILLAIDQRTGRRRSLPARVVRKLGHYRTQTAVWLLARPLGRWRAANAAGTRLLEQRLQRGASVVPQAILDPLKADHGRYITTVSNSDMAASWEFVLLLLRLLATGAFESVVDFGSGFTSYAIRYWRQRSGALLAIASVDDSPAWLQKTRDYLTQAGVDADHLWLEHDYLAGGGPRPVDLLVYDYSLFDQRVRFLPQIAQLIRPASIVLFDDYNRRSYNAHYVNMLDLWCWRNSMQLADLSAHTRDAIGRYAALGYNPHSGAFEELLRRL